MSLSVIELFQIVSAIAACVFVVIFIPVAFQLFATLKSANRLIKDLREEVGPSLEQLRNAMESLSDNLRSGQEILHNVTNITRSLDRTAKVAEDFFTSPWVRAINMILKIVRTITPLIRRKR